MDLKQDISQGAPELCARFGIRRLGVFGSVARGEDNAGSDIDFYAEFDDQRPDTMPDRYFGFIEAAARRFRRPVQVLTPRMVRNPFLRHSIDRDLLIIHE